MSWKRIFSNKHTSGDYIFVNIMTIGVFLEKKDTIGVDSVYVVVYFVV